MVHSKINREIFIRNYISLFKPSKKSKQSQVLFIGVVFLILCACIFFRQYLAAFLILVRAIKTTDEKYIRNKRHAGRFFDTNTAIKNGIDFDITDLGLVVGAEGCVYNLGWDSFILFIESDEIVYVEHKFGGKYYLLKNLINVEQNRLLHEKLAFISPRTP